MKKKIAAMVIALMMGAWCIGQQDNFYVSADDQQVVTPQATAVAKIGDKEYTSLDEAIEDAKEGATIELLSDARIDNGFNKSLTITGNGTITTDKQLKSNGEQWMCFGLYDPSRVLTLDGEGVKWVWTSDGSAPWLMLSLSGKLNVKNGAELTFQFDSRPTGARNAIDMNADSEINVTNGGKLQILGVGTAANTGQGIQLDAAGKAKINVTGNSTFLIDGTNRGYVNSPTIYVENSQFSVINCTSNGSNGGQFTAIDSEINYLNNNGHGLSAGDVVFKNSVVNCNQNAYYGLTYSGNLTMDRTSKLYANGNGYGYTGGGIRGYGISLVEKGAFVEVLENQHNGLENYGTFTFENGVELTIAGNDERTTNGGGIFNGGSMILPENAVITDNHAFLTGGGICNAGSIVIPKTVEIYNNIAGNAGDDIYSRANTTWQLESLSKGALLNDGHEVTNWFYDGGNPDYDIVNGSLKEAGLDHRWDLNLYAKIYQYLEKSDEVNEAIGLKAAYTHQTSITPADLTLYTGGDGYENVAGTTDGDDRNGFPEPGYYVSLPKEINDLIQADGQPADLSSDTGEVRFTYTYTGAEEDRVWHLTKYAANESTMNGNYVYRLSLVLDEQTTMPTLLVYQEGQLDEAITSDNFDITSAVYTEYRTRGANVEGQTIDETELIGNIQTEQMDVDFDQTTIKEGQLTIRGVADKESEHLIADVQMDGSQPIEGQPLATVPEETTFYINGEMGMEIQEEAQPALLFDEILPEGEDLDNARRIAWLKVKAEEVCTDGALLEELGITNPQYDFKYMDLVDSNNGNVVLTADKAVTVHMPYPKGVDQDTLVLVLHYKDLEREIAYEDVQSAIMESDVEVIEIEQAEDHIQLTTDSFSPFVVIWGSEEATEPEIPTEQEKPNETVTTGDVGTIGISIAAILVLASLSGAGYAIYYKKKFASK